MLVRTSFRPRTGRIPLWGMHGCCNEGQVSSQSRESPQLTRVLGIIALKRRDRKTGTRQHLDRGSGGTVISVLEGSVFQFAWWWIFLLSCVLQSNPYPRSCSLHLLVSEFRCYTRCSRSPSNSNYVCTLFFESRIVEHTQTGTIRTENAQDKGHRDHSHPLRIRVPFEFQPGARSHSTSVPSVAYPDSRSPPRPRCPSAFSVSS